VPQQEPAGAEPVPGPGAGCWEQNVPGRTCGTGRARTRGRDRAASTLQVTCQGGLRTRPGASLGSRGVCVGAQLPCRGAPCPRAGLAAPLPPAPEHHPCRPGSRAAALGSPPRRRRPLPQTLFWMFMGSQFPPGSEAAELPSRGASNPPRPASGPCLAAQGDARPPAPLSSWHGEGAWELCLCRGLAPVTKKSAANKILMGTYCILQLPKFGGGKKTPS